MDFYFLEHMLALAKHKNFTKASEEMNISQSALSQRIAKLEDELGVKLFERTTRTLHILPAGEAFIEYAKNIMEEYRHAKNTMEAHKEAQYGTLIIGGFPVVSSYNVIGLIANFARMYPKVKLIYKEADCFDLIEMLRTYEIDMAFFHRQIKEPDLSYHDLMSDEIVIIVNEKHPFAKNNNIHLSEAKNENFILSPSNSLIFFDVLESCRIAGFEPKIVYNCIHISSMIGFVSENLGITLLSHQVALDYLIPGVTIVKITPSITRTLTVALRKDGHVIPTIRAFMELVQKENP